MFSPPVNTVKPVASSAQGGSRTLSCLRLSQGLHCRRHRLPLLFAESEVCHVPSVMSPSEFAESVCLLRPMRGFPCLSSLVSWYDEAGLPCACFWVCRSGGTGCEVLCVHVVCACRECARIAQAWCWPLVSLFIDLLLLSGHGDPGCTPHLGELGPSASNPWHWVGHMSRSMQGGPISGVRGEPGSLFGLGNKGEWASRAGPLFSPCQAPRSGVRARVTSQGCGSFPRTAVLGV